MQQTCLPLWSPNTGPSLHIRFSKPAGGLCWVPQGRFTLSIEQSVSHTDQHLCPTQQHEPNSVTCSGPCLYSLLVPKTWQSCFSPKPTTSRVLSPTFSPAFAFEPFRDIGFLKRSVICRSACPLTCPALCSWGADTGAEA